MSKKIPQSHWDFIKITRAIIFNDWLTRSQIHWAFPFISPQSITIYLSFMSKFSYLYVERIATWDKSYDYPGFQNFDYLYKYNKSDKLNLLHKV